MFLDVVQIVQLASVAEFHCENPSTGIPPVDTRSLDEGEVFKHRGELLLVPGLLLEVQFVGEVGSHFSSQPLEVEVWEDKRHAGH